jgi:NADPH-dependent F420 reductase
MKLAIIGTGNVGAGLGRLLAAEGHDVTFGVREPQSSKVASLLEQVSGAVAVRVKDAIAGSDVIVLAVPWEAAEGIVKAADLDGKVLVDATNPIAPGLELALGYDTSAAERIAGWAPGARVVKAFNTIGANNLENPRFGDENATMFVCGDDAGAKAVTSQLAEELGFEVVDAGGLASARLLEPVAMLWIRLALVEGWGRDIAFKLLRR